MRIRISWPTGAITGYLNDTHTGQQLVKLLPVSSVAQTWGAEVYFSVPLKTPLDDAPKQVVDPGTICFWVQGSAVAIPYGPTPVSVGNECRLVTAVNVIGKLDGEPCMLAAIQEGDTITLEAVEA